MKIVIIGAGHGGLTAAYGLAHGGHNVTVFEKKPKEKLSYDWHDDADPSVFKDLGIPMPPEGTYFRKREWSVNIPGTNEFMKLNQDPETLDISFRRRPLAHLLADRAESAGAKILFGTPVERLIADGARVSGVIAGGEKVRADLVIDSSGVMSPFRESLAAGSYVSTCKPDELFYNFRAFFEANEAAERNPVHTNRCYAKYMGKPGISWCIEDPDGSVNVLIGTAGGLKKAELDEILTQLKKDNPIIGEKILCGGIMTVIPVRYPSEKPMTDGYIAVGDAAFMTIPLIGSGIASSMRAGAMLADALNRDNSADIKTLWRYHVRFMREIGAEHIAIDCVKRWLLGADVAELNAVFGLGVIEEKDFIALMTGGMLKLSLGDMLKKAVAGRKNLPLMLKLGKMLLKSMMSEKTGRKIPAEYDAEKAAAWGKKIRKYFE
ncbi:MAG: NAD(P)/FAD-dependent oxidoreductase [Clostridiales bacterium]|jgi:flavin-dependent dehydrogenase|nr:NAD(P)/FAD-dependent oxidoreductase [Clostridiales bacterium]